MEVQIHSHAHQNETSINKSISCVCRHLHTYHYGNLKIKLKIPFVASPFVVTENLQTILVCLLIQHVRNDEKVVQQQGCQICYWKIQVCIITLYYQTCLVIGKTNKQTGLAQWFLIKGTCQNYLRTFFKTHMPRFSHTRFLPPQIQLGFKQEIIF